MSSWASSFFRSRARGSQLLEQVAAPLDVGGDLGSYLTRRSRAASAGGDSSCGSAHVAPALQPCTQVRPRLWVGNAEAACDRSQLKAAGVTHVVCLLSAEYCAYPDQVSYLLLPFNDMLDAPLSSALATAAPWVAKALEGGGTVFVHCAAGVSRSPALVIGLLMLLDKLSFNDAYETVKAAHPQTRPNAGFVAYLRGAGSPPSPNGSEPRTPTSPVMQGAFGELELGGL